MLVLVTDRWDSALGGSQRYLADLAERLARRGQAVRVYARSGLADERAELVRVPALGAIGPGVGELSFEKSLARRLLAERPPILAVRPADGATHFQPHSGLYADAFEAERESFDGLRRLLHRPAGKLNLKRRLLLAAEERFLGCPRPPRVMAFSRRVAASVARRYGIPEAEIAVEPPGIDETRFRPPSDPEPPASPVFLYVANNFVLKGLGFALEALARVRRRLPAARLLVAGTGARPPFERLARRLGVLDAVTFLGSVPQEKLAVLYRSSSALLHPTFFDPFSLVAAEALSSGCPVVTTAQNGAAEHIEAGRHGFVVEDPRDVDALETALLALADVGTNRAMRPQAARLGARFAFERHADVVLAWLGL